VLAFFASSGNSGIEPASGMLERFDLQGDDLNLEGATYVKAAAGATERKWATDSSGFRNSSSFGQLVALRSACTGTAGRPRIGQRPAIVSEPYVGRRVSAYRGSWCGRRAMHVRYRWKRCTSTSCTAIKGGTRASYIPTLRDADRTLKVSVTASNSSGTTTVTSKGKRVGGRRLVNTALPTISGTPQDGFELSASSGTWTGAESSAYSYAWQRCETNGAGCSVVPSATRSVYMLTDADVGSTMRVTVTASNSAGSASATSSATGVVSAAPASPAPPANTAPPTISGSPSEQGVLTGSSGTWVGTTPMTYGYQWLRCDTAGSKCSAVTGATQDTYGIGPGDVGSTLRLAVTATNGAGSSSATSLGTQAVTASPAPPLNSAPPAIIGTPEVGSLLSASTGAWTGTTPIDYAFQWRRCDQAGANCSSISGATEASYSVVVADGGSTLRVLVTAVNTVGSNIASSIPTAAVPAVLPASFFNGPTGSNNVIPAKPGAFLGTWTDGSWTTMPQNFVNREAQLGRKLDVYEVHYGAPRGTCYATAPLSPGIESWAWGRGVYPFVSWSPGYTIAEVNSGAYDSCFRDVAQRFKAFGHPIWLRLWWEFNGTWMLWSYDPANAQPFIDAWRRVVGIFQSVGADNTMFVWSPSEDFYNPSKRQVGYPRDAYVDWVASDSYNWNKSDAWCGPFHAGWCEFWEKFHHGYSGAKAVGVEVDFRNRKPYLIAETGSLEDLSTPGRKGQWMRNMRDAIKNEFPGLRMLLYSDFDLTTTEGVNWRVDTSQSSLDGFTALARDAYFNTR
jgi:hypothetical protein